MPQKPLRPCKKAGCRNLTREGYCKEHKQLELLDKQERNKYYDQQVRHKRDKKYTEFYHSKAWGIVRQQALIRDNGLCQHCLKENRITLADMVHHIKSIKAAWHLRLVLSNLISLCNSCHNKIERREGAPEKF
ncbi:HNH endonuclease [Clostridium formicaceticum]|uniref:Putative HNH nuclease YajD n=1 Tax=Clostridium formicaceticum TaxID=1497 RepID=A0AAC9WFV8_9CLOT|nr:HNH endonuclease [Clostridium formicaceticum]AOY76674.1 HNH endonuclease [Clostridium formicaceticum]ARE87104.1 HNH endonuclease [Clostridium formicaceticum]